MIKTIRGTVTRQFVEAGKSKFSGLDVRLADKRLFDLSKATSLHELSPLNSLGLHKLKGNKSDFWAIKINGPWRIIFRFVDGDAYDVEIVDYH
jgi:toxin HigB-1